MGPYTETFISINRNQLSILPSLAQTKADFIKMTNHLGQQTFPKITFFLITLLYYRFFGDFFSLFNNMNTVGGI